jgi:mannitol-1-/sugar-/sorbitol-6-phosphatase
LVNARGLLFDLDGVLVDSAASIDRHWREFAKWYALDPDRLLDHSHGRRPADTITKVAGDLPVDPVEAIARHEALEVRDQLGVLPLPGTVDVLSLLSFSRWAVVTSASRPVARARMNAAGLPEPPVLISASDVPNGKPDPAPYQQGANQLGLKPEAMVAVEDSPAGIESACTAGCKTLALTTTHAVRELQLANFCCSTLQSVEVAHADYELVQLRITHLSSI